jgi:ribonuclease BN (tRNA processing enzyme)
MRFMGVGGPQNRQLGNAAAVLEAEWPLLLIDCGPDTLPTYMEVYHGALPQAIFVTHAHMDHIGGLENLFYQAYFAEAYRGRIKLFVPVKLIDVLHKRLADYPSILAEGGANFWDCFQLIPVSDSFWHEELMFDVFPVRHHDFLSAYGIALQGVFLYTGDTRPIPEVLNSYACRGEVIFHDCCMSGSPSHSGIRDIERDYKPEQLQRMVLYHYESEQAGADLAQQGYGVASKLQRIPLRADERPGRAQPQLATLPIGLHGDGVSVAQLLRTGGLP